MITELAIAGLPYGNHTWPNVIIPALNQGWADSDWERMLRLEERLPCLDLAWPV